ncbi:MAG: PorT family protein [Muribaculaceae bacterium]|nr:PorT family protein [Muribaculaceae bacterium]
MLHRILSICISFLIIQSAYAQTESTDTLLTASNAKELSIKQDDTGISITVKNVNGEPENFYYDTSGTSCVSADETTLTKFKDVTDIRIIETGGRRLEVNFKSAGANGNSLSFEIPDPENRTVSSYLGPKRNDFGLNLTPKGKNQLVIFTGGFSGGWVTPLNSSPSLDTSMGRSGEFAWNFVLGIGWQRGRHALKTGLGLKWSNYVMRNGRYFRKNPGGEISLEPFEEGAYKTTSALHMFSLQIPLMYALKFGKQRQFSFSFGPVACFNTGGHITTKYRIGDVSTSISTGKIGQRPVTMDLLAAISWYKIGLYARYSPMRVLKSSTGLDFASFSTGFTIYL